MAAAAAAPTASFILGFGYHRQRKAQRKRCNQNWTFLHGKPSCRRPRQSNG
jgi:hypothetical protein